MLRDLNVDQARFIALLARTARTQRDALLGNVAEEDLDGVTPGRGERNPTAELGFEALPARIRRQLRFAKQLLRCRGQHVRSYTR